MQHNENQSTSKIKLVTPFLPTMGDQSKIMSIDLHGCGEKEVRDCIQRTIKNAPGDGIEKIRFITGRGNHVNAKGQRGTLYKNFRSWVMDVENHGCEIQQFDGFYEISMRENIPVRNPLQAFLNDQVKHFLVQDIANIVRGAQQGNKDDLLALATCYQHGLGVEQNYKKSAAIHEKLAEDGNVLAQYEIGCSYFIGRGVRQNDIQARKFLLMAADQNYALAQLLLGNVYWNGIGTKKDDAKAVFYHEAAAKQGQAESARKLGCAYNEGRGVKADFEQALYWWNQAAKRGDCVAAYNLSIVYRNNESIKDLNLAFTYTQLSAELGDPDGMCDLALGFFQGNQIKRDVPLALDWFEKAADNGSAEAMYFLFQYYHHHSEEGKNPKTYFMRAAEAGHIVCQILISFPACPFEFDADYKREIMNKLLAHSKETILKLNDQGLMFLLIDLLLCKDNSKNQRKKGLNILIKLAQDNCPEALGRLGAVYMRGIATKSNPQEAYRYWLQGAKIGNKECQCALGYYWQDGLGGKKNDKKAYEYFMQSAEKGSANAYNQLGIFYQEGRFVKMDYQLAEQQFLKAMELDIPSQRQLDEDPVFRHAAYNLAMMYFVQKEFFNKSLPEIVELFKQSAADGNEQACIFIYRYYFKLGRKEDALQYLLEAQKLGNIHVVKIIDKINTSLSTDKINSSTRAVNNTLSSQSIFSASLKNKHEVQSELKKISEALDEKLSWNITKNNQAWAYISEKHKNALTNIPNSTIAMKKTSNGGYIVLINSVYKCDFVELLDNLTKNIKMKEYEHGN